MKASEIRAKAKQYKLKEQAVTTELFGDLIIRELSGKQFVHVSQLALEGKSMNQGLFLDYAILYSIYSTDSEQVFTDSDIEIIQNFPADVYSQLLTIVTKLNNMEGATVDPKN